MKELVWKVYGGYPNHYHQLTKSLHDEDEAAFNATQQPRYFRK
jgi:hypothetical protein